MAGVEFLVFEGVSSDLRPWISALEDQFSRDDYSDLNKLALAVYLIGGRAEAFVHHRMESKYFYTWEDLKSSFLLRFGERDDPERIRLLAERNKSMQNRKVATKIKNIEANPEMTMTIPDVSESQVESAPDPAIHIRDEDDSTTKTESTDLMVDIVSDSVAESLEIASVLEKDSGTTDEMFQLDSENIESQENKVSTSLLEPSHKIDEMQSILIENSSSPLLVNGSRYCDGWFAPKVEQPYILDVDEVGDLIQKSVESVDLVAHQLFDQMLKRFCCKMKQRKCNKNWKFKYRDTQSMRSLPCDEPHEVVRRRKIVCKMRLRQRSCLWYKMTIWAIRAFLVERCLAFEIKSALFLHEITLQQKRKSYKPWMFKYRAWPRIYAPNAQKPSHYNLVLRERPSDFSSGMFTSMLGGFSNEVMSGISDQNSEEKAQIRLCLMCGPELESYVLLHNKLHIHYCFEGKEYYSIQAVLWFKMKILCLMGKALRSVQHEGYMWRTLWVSTVSGCTLKRGFLAVVQLANGEIPCGQSLYPEKGLKKAEREFEVVYITGRDKGREFCLKRSLSRETMPGKMVLKVADVHLMIIATGTPAFFGTESANMVNVVAFKATMDGAKDVTMSDLEFVKDTIMMGSERKSAVIKLSYNGKLRCENMGIESKLIILVNSLEPKRWFTEVGFLCFMGEKFQSIERKVHQWNCIVQWVSFWMIEHVSRSSGVWHRWKNKSEIREVVPGFVQCLLLSCWSNTREKISLNIGRSSCLVVFSQNQARQHGHTNNSTI